MGDILGICQQIWIKTKIYIFFKYFRSFTFLYSAVESWINEWRKILQRNFISTLLTNIQDHVLCSSSILLDFELLFDIYPVKYCNRFLIKHTPRAGRELYNSGIHDGGNRRHIGQSLLCHSWSILLQSFCRYGSHYHAISSASS